MGFKQDMDTGAAVVGCSALAMMLIVLDVLLAIYRGWVLSVLWGWFALPLGAAPNLSVVEASGVVLIVSVFFAGRTHYKKHEADIIGTLTYAVLAPLVTLITGWLLLLIAT
jgi:hypothetical protein